MVVFRNLILFLALFAALSVAAEDLGEAWGTAEAEAEYYPIVNIAIPPEVPMRPGSFEILPDGRLAVGTRRGDIYFIEGAFENSPVPKYHLFASGQDEIFGLSWKDGVMTATSSPSRSEICVTSPNWVAVITPSFQESPKISSCPLAKR